MPAYFLEHHQKQMWQASTIEVLKQGLILASKCYNQMRKFNTLCNFFGRYEQLFLE